MTGLWLFVISGPVNSNGDSLRSLAESHGLSEVIDCLSTDSAGEVLVMSVSLASSCSDASTNHKSTALSRRRTKLAVVEF